VLGADGAIEDILLDGNTALSEDGIDALLPLLSRRLFTRLQTSEVLFQQSQLIIRVCLPLAITPTAAVPALRIFVLLGLDERHQFLFADFVTPSNGLQLSGLTAKIELTSSAR